MNNASGRLLIVDDDAEVLTLLCEVLSGLDYEAVGVRSPGEALEELSKKPFDVLLADLVMPEMDGINLLRTCFEADPRLMGIIITGQGSIATAVEAMKLGAFHYILKPVDFGVLKTIVSRAMEVRRMRDENVQLRDTIEIYRLKQAVRETEDIYRTIFENTGTAMAIFEEDTTISVANSEFEKLSGYSKDEIEGKKNWMEFVTEADIERVRCFHHQVLIDPSVPIESFEFRFVDGLGNTKDILLSGGILPGTKRGVASLLDITGRKKTEREIRAYQGALRSLASELSLAEERERRSIAEVLHDDIGQNLAVARIKLCTLEEYLGTNEYGGRVCDIRRLVEQTIQHTRSLTHDLSPVILYEFGFEVAVETLVEAMQETYGLTIEIENDGQPKALDDDIQILLYKAVKELLVNTVKHAQANRVDISITRDGDSIQVLVEDDGIGFEASKLGLRQGSTQGFGLFNIRERLESVKGCFDVASAPGYGTKVAMVAPLQKEIGDV